MKVFKPYLLAVLFSSNAVDENIAWLDKKKFLSDIIIQIWKKMAEKMGHIKG